MHTINLVEKAYIILADYKATLRTAVLENIVIRNGKKHNHNKVSYNYFGSPTQADHNSRRSKYSPVFFILFSCFGCGKFEKTLFITGNVQKPGLFYIFISSVGDTLRHMYVKMHLKGSVGLFQKHFASISETHF